ncbi:hypothetical protein Tco_1359261, partial [Tanacetum coccineum]
MRGRGWCVVDGGDGGGEDVVGGDSGVAGGGGQGEAACCAWSRTQVTEDTHVIITAPVNPEGQQQSFSVSSGFVSNMLNPSLDIGIDLIFTLNTEETSLVDVPVTTIAEPHLLSATTLPPTPLITHLQQTPVP